MKPNVRLESTGVVHAHARNSRQILRCGTRFLRHEGERAHPADTRSRGEYTEAPVDCMACLVRNEWCNASLGEILVENAEDAQHAATFTWRTRKKPP